MEGETLKEKPKNGNQLRILDEKKSSFRNSTWSTWRWPRQDGTLIDKKSRKYTKWKKEKKTRRKMRWLLNQNLIKSEVSLQGWLIEVKHVARFYGLCLVTSRHKSAVWKMWEECRRDRHSKQTKRSFLYSSPSKLACSVSPSPASRLLVSCGRS